MRAKEPAGQGAASGLLLTLPMAWHGAMTLTFPKLSASKTLVIIPAAASRLTQSSAQHGTLGAGFLNPLTVQSSIGQDVRRQQQERRPKLFAVHERHAVQDLAVGRRESAIF